MNITRRSFLAGATAIGVTAAVNGCKTVPSKDTMRKLGLAFGASTGLVLDQCALEDKARNVIIDIVNRGYMVVPAEGQTIFDAWKETAESHVATLITDGKITTTEGDLILTAFDLVLTGFAILIDRNPEIGTYGELAIVAIGGFCAGFLTVYKPANATNGCDGSCEIDMQVYRALQVSTEARALGFR